MLSTESCAPSFCACGVNCISRTCGINGAVLVVRALAPGCRQAASEATAEVIPPLRREACRWRIEATATPSCPCCFGATLPAWIGRCSSLCGRSGWKHTVSDAPLTFLDFWNTAQGGGFLLPQAAAAPHWLRGHDAPLPSVCCSEKELAAVLVRAARTGTHGHVAQIPTELFHQRREVNLRDACLAQA